MKLKEELRKKIEDSTVRIKVESIEMNWNLPYQVGEIHSGSGSGFFISKNVILTCSHVIDGARNIYIEIPALDQRIMKVEVLGFSPKFDIALLKTLDYESKRWLELGDSKNCKIGDEVMVVGYPKNYSQSKNNVNNLKYTTGIISGQQYGFIQTDSAINSGNSGGPMLLDGKVIGINSRKMTGEDTDLIGYAAPIHHYLVIEKEFHSEDRKKNKLIHRPALAFEYSNSNQTLLEMITETKKTSETGIYVSYIYPHSPILEIGMQVGDLMTKIHGKDIDNFGMVDHFWFNTKQDVFTYMNLFENGAKIDIEFIRKGKVYKKKLTLREYIVPVRLMYPMYEEIDFFIFAGMVFMNMCMNHIEGNPEALVRYLTAQEITKPKVIITFIYPNQPTAILNNFQKMDVIKKVNDEEIHTIQDMIKAIQKKNIYQGREVVKLETNDEYVMVLDVEEMVMNDVMLSKLYKFPLTPFHMERMKGMNQMIPSKMNKNMTNGKGNGNQAKRSRIHLMKNKSKV